MALIVAAVDRKWALGAAAQARLKRQVIDRLVEGIACSFACIFCVYCLFCFVLIVWIVCGVLH